MTAPFIRYVCLSLIIAHILDFFNGKHIFNIYPSYGNGFDFLPFVKNTYGIPVIMLTANDLESDIVAGLEAGADVQGFRFRLVGASSPTCRNFMSDFF